MAYKRRKRRERIFRGAFRVKIMVNREGCAIRYHIKFIYLRFDQLTENPHNTDDLKASF